MLTPEPEYQAVRDILTQEFATPVRVSDEGLQRVFEVVIEEQPLAAVCPASWVLGRVPGAVSPNSPKLTP